MCSSFHKSKFDSYESKTWLCSSVLTHGFFRTSETSGDRGKFMSNSEVNGMLSPRPSSNLGLKSGSVVKNLGAQLGKAKDNASSKQVAESPHAAADNTPNNNSAPAPNLAGHRLWVGHLLGLLGRIHWLPLRRITTK